MQSCKRPDPPPSPHPLSPSEVEDSRRERGSNTLSVKRRKSFIRQFVGNLNDPVIRILLCALSLNLIFSFKGGDPFETIGIGLAVFLATLISTLSEYGSESAFARLSEACAQAVCRVRRCDGERGPAVVKEIPLGEAVVGDIAVLAPGEMIPADGFLLSGQLTVDQSAMTGESREVQKTPVSPSVPLPDHASPADPSALFRGCVILGGSGEMLVSRVGDSTFLGEISGEVQEDTRESPLKIRLARLARQISRLGYVAAALVAVVYLLGAFVFDGIGGGMLDRALMVARLCDGRYVWESLFHALTLGLTVLVVAVPEGLPMMIAVVLSSNIQKMVKDEVLVRKPVGIEAAGSMNILFSDKTGTLTEGRLSVGSLVCGDGVEFADVEAFSRGAPVLYARFREAAVTNTLSVAGTGDGDTSPRALGGNATDRALLDAVLRAGGADMPTPLPTKWKIPFDSVKKLSCATAVRDGKPVLCVKGSPEKLLPRVVDAYRADGSRGKCDRSALTRRIRELTARGERVLLLAEQVEGEIPARASLESGDLGRLRLTLTCILTLSDRLRPEAPEAVATLRRAGIHVVMMTGDNRDTARAIAKECGILGDGVDTVLDSEELSRMSDSRLSEILPRVGVIARALPTDKSRLVRLSQASELVVGMTGDGINDAPALKRADIGFAMGAGTQVAKDAGDIIIMDNNLRSIARAVLYGRTIFKSIRKFITLQLTMNLCAVGVTMICPFLGIEAPVTVVQMLWINLIMDTLGGLAFAGEAPLPSYMEEAPKRRDEPILNRYMAGKIAYLGGFTVSLCLLFLKHPAITSLFRPAGNDIYLLTAFFALFIFASVFNCLNARTDRLNLTAGLGRNRAFLGIMLAVGVIQILFVYLGGSVLRTAPLTVSELAVTSAMALSVIPAGILHTAIRRRRGKKEGY